MANKLLLNNDDIAYEPSESEDELSEGEKEILKEVRQGKQRKADSKQEVLAFDDSDDADDDDADIIGDSDIERGDEDDGIPDSKAWGKQRKSYYNTDFVDQDYSGYNEQEEEQAQQEEEEAKAIQLRLAKQLDEADFFLDLPTGDASDSDEDTKVKDKKDKSSEGTKLKADLSNLSQRQLEELLKKDSPEFAGLVDDFQTYLEESRNILTPVIEFADSMDLHLPIFDFVRTRDNMLMTYCTNVAFYLLLKSERISIKNHPLTKRLVTLKKLITQVDERYNDIVKPQLEELLQRINSGEEFEIDLEPVKKIPKQKSKKLRMMKEYEEDEENDESLEEDEPSIKRVKFANEDDGGSSTGDDDDDDDDEIKGANEDDEEGEEDEEGEAERRGITYQIAKNKGLMPHRKKEHRNPRVKHRGKFRKALIRRKGAVRTVRKESKRYGGEISGIKATTKKGIKIKS